MTKDFFNPDDCDLLGWPICAPYGQDGLKSKGLSISKANRLLRERGKVVYGGRAHDFHWSTDQYGFDDLKALLINIEPIEAGSAESIQKVLREAIGYLERNYPLMSYPEDEKYRADIAYRAKKLLGEK